MDIAERGTLLSKGKENPFCVGVISVAWPDLLCRRSAFLFLLFEGGFSRWRAGGKGRRDIGVRFRSPPEIGCCFPGMKRENTISENGRRRQLDPDLKRKGWARPWKWGGVTKEIGKGGGGDSRGPVWNISRLILLLSFNRSRISSLSLQLRKALSFPFLLFNQKQTRKAVLGEQKKPPPNSRNPQSGPGIRRTFYGIFGRK